MFDLVRRKERLEKTEPGLGFNVLQTKLFEFWMGWFSISQLFLYVIENIIYGKCQCLMSCSTDLHADVSINR